MSEPEILGVDEAIDFWDRRHKYGGELLSGGDKSYTHEQNELFYSLRLGRLIDVLGLGLELDPPRHLLDAGCGKGWFSASMARFGHRVDGIDSSDNAIALCRSRASEREHYEVSTLSGWDPGTIYDAVYCVDVLFHIMDDDAWAESLLNLGRLVRVGGLLAVADHGADEDRVWGSYQKTRARSSYDSALADVGLVRRGDFVPYQFDTSAAGFHVFAREA